MVLPHDEHSGARNPLTYIAPDRLMDFPMQGEVYCEPNQAALDQICTSILDEGMRDPIHVLPSGNAAGLPDNTMLDGHSRRDAAIALGLDEVPVLVRHDLLDASMKEVTLAFLDYNSVRRQLDPIDLATVLVKRHNASSRYDLRANDIRGINRVASQLAGLIVKSSKTAGRYVRVAMLPVVIQNAVQSDRLRLTNATKIFSLNENRWEEVAEAVEAALETDADVNAVVASFVTKPIKKPKANPAKDITDLCKLLEAFDEKHGERIQGMTSPGWAAHLDRLVSGKAVLDRLVAQLQTIDPDADAFAGIADLMEEDDD